MLIAMIDPTTRDTDPFNKMESLVQRAKTQVQNASTGQGPQAGAQNLNFDDPSVRESFISGLQNPGAFAQEALQHHALDPEKVAALLELE